MENDRSAEVREKLSRKAFFIVVNGLLGRTLLCEWVNTLEHRVRVDEEGNITPQAIGGIYLMLHSALGTEYVHTSERINIRKLKEFLDPYLEPRYRPQSDEPPPALYLGGR
jgi:hypothetical protein